MAGKGRKPLSARLWLTIGTLPGIFNAINRFHTDLSFEFSFFGETINISFQKEMIP